MQIQVDLRDWIAYSLGPPGPLGLLLNPTPIVDANLQDTIYDVIDLALEAAMRNAQAYQSDLQAIDPFLSTHDLWVLGCPAAVYFNGHTLHFIDSIGDLTSGDLTSPADAITLTLRPRDDIKIKKEVLGSLSDRFGDAIGLQALTTGHYFAVIDKILDMLLDVQFTSKVREALDHLQNRENSFDTLVGDDNVMSRIKRIADARQILERVSKSMGEFIAPSIDLVAKAVVATILGRSELPIYNEFSTKIGLEFVLHYWIPFSYPTRIWREIEKGEGPTFLSEIGSRLWRFNILQQRAMKTANALTQPVNVDDLVNRSIADNLLQGRIGALDFLKSDETVEWWFEKETIALRYYLIAIFSFPESFLTLLKGEDANNFKDTVTKMLGCKKTDGDQLTNRLLQDNKTEQIQLTDVLQKVFERIPDSSKLVRGQSNPKEFIRTQRMLQQVKSNEESLQLLFLYYQIRNSLVHGTNFHPSDSGSLSFSYKGKRYLVDYDTLAFGYHLLPAIVAQVYKAYSSQQ